MNLPAHRSQINIESAQVLLKEPTAEGGVSVILQSAIDGTEIRGADRLLLKGEGYDSRQSAEEGAAAWRSRLIAGFASIGMGVDLGTRAPGSGITDFGKEHLARQFGVERVLNDEHGTMIYECDPPPKFASFSGQAIVGKPGPSLIDFLKTAGECSVTSRQEAAFELYGASFFVDNADARFTLLMMAVETLVEQKGRSEEAQTHVDQLIELTRDSQLSPSEIKSMVSALEWLLLESIGQAGRRLVGVLTSKTYSGMSASRFFTDCYETRSALVHGQTPRPSRSEVDQRAASLETLVGDLLAASIECQ